MAKKSKEDGAVMVMEQKSVPLSSLYGQSVVTLDRIDNTVYPNSRRNSGGEMSMVELCRSLEAPRGQIQNVVVAFVEVVDEAGKKSFNPNGKLGLVAGFRRVEAFTQNALRPLFNKYNAENGKKSSDDGFLNVTVVDHRRQLQELRPEEYLAALKSQTVKVDICKVEDNVDAALVNIAENFNREEVSVGDFSAFITNLIEVQQVQQKRIAEQMGCHKSKVSQYAKVGRLVRDLHELLDAPSEVSEADLPKHKDKVNLILNELDRRMHLNPKEEKQAIHFSHLREFSDVVSKRNDTGNPVLNTEGLLFALKHLTRVDNGGNPTDVACLDISAFRDYLKSAVELSKKMVKAEGVASETTEGDTATDATSTEAGTSDKTGGKEVSMEELAAQQKSGTVPPSITTGTTTPVATPVTGEGATTPATTTVTDATVTGEVDEDALLEYGDSDGDTDPTDADLTGDATATKPTETGTGTRKEAPPENKYKPIEFSSMEKYASSLVEAAADATTDMVEAAGQLYAASHLYLCLGMDEEDTHCNELYEQMSKDVQVYVQALETYAQKAYETGITGNKKFPKFELSRPGFPTGIEELDS